MDYSPKEAFLYGYAYDGLDEFCSEKMKQLYTINGNTTQVPLFIDSSGDMLHLDVLDTIVPDARILIEKGTNNILVFPGNREYPKTVQILEYQKDQSITLGVSNAVDVFRQKEQQRTSSGQQYISSSELSAGAIYFLVGVLPEPYYSIAEGKNIDAFIARLSVQGNFYRDYNKPATGDSSSDTASLVDNAGKEIEVTVTPTSQLPPKDTSLPGLTLDEGRLVRFATFDASSGKMVDASNSEYRGQPIQHEIREDGYLYDAQSGALLVTNTYLYYKYDKPRESVGFVSIKEKKTSYLWLWLFGGAGVLYLAKKKKKR